MEKKKFKIEELKVESFVTNKTEQAIQGGGNSFDCNSTPFYYCGGTGYTCVGDSGCANPSGPPTGTTGPDTQAIHCGGTGGGGETSAYCETMGCTNYPCTIYNVDCN